MSKTINTDWQTFKVLVTPKNLLVQYIEKSSFYDIFAVDGPVLFQTSIIKQIPATVDQQDFETNYKDIVTNKPIPTLVTGSSEETTPPIRVQFPTQSPPTVVVEGQEGLTSKLRYDILTKDQSISTSNFTSLYSYFGSGRLYGLELQFSYNKIEFQLIIDGEIITNGINIDDIAGNLISANMLIIRPTNKEITMAISNGIKYSSSIEIKAKSEDNAKKLIYGYVIVSKVS